MRCRGLFLAAVAVVRASLRTAVCAPGTEMGEGELRRSELWMPARLPCTALSTLVANGVYPEPFVGLNNDVLSLARSPSSPALTLPPALVLFRGAAVALPLPPSARAAKSEAPPPASHAPSCPDASSSRRGAPRNPGMCLMAPTLPSLPPPVRITCRQADALFLACRCRDGPPMPPDPPGLLAGGCCR